MGAVRTLVDELRRRGVTVHEWSGWDGRGNSDGGTGPRVTQIDPVGAVIHHTGSDYGSAYAGLVSSTRPELLGGCLCNFAGNEDGSLTVIASGLAWHAGPGVGPSLGPVLSKVPNIRNRMNRLTVALEIVYPGDRPMRDAQYRTACLFAATVADLFAGGDIECVRAHAETNGNAPGGSGKWDPGYAPGKTLDMAVFRRDAANLTADGGLPMPLDKITADQISVIVRDWAPQAVNAPTIDWGVKVGKTSVAQTVADTYKMAAAMSGQIAGLTAAVQALAAGGGVDLAQIEAASRRGTEAALSGFEATVVIGPANGPVS